MVFLLLFLTWSTSQHFSQMWEVKEHFPQSYRRGIPAKNIQERLSATNKFYHQHSNVVIKLSHMPPSPKTPILCLLHRCVTVTLNRKLLTIICMICHKTLPVLSPFCPPPQPLALTTVTVKSVLLCSELLSWVLLELPLVAEISSSVIPSIFKPLASQVEHVPLTQHSHCASV